MALYYPGCTETIVPPSNSDCPQKELGDIRSIAIIRKDVAMPDPTDSAAWTAGILAGTIFTFPQVKGNLEISENEQDGFGDQPTSIDGYDFTLTTFHPDYKSNWAFWNSIKSSTNWRVAYRTESQIHISDFAAQINPKAPVADGKKTAILWNVVFKFSQEGPVRPYDTPEGVFDRAIAVS